ncbi:MAG: PadR family transcriptional regulator [Dehalococcoidia bacterium]
MLKDFVLGFVRIHILYHAKVGPIYGAWVMQELERHGYELTPGTLYPILHELEGKRFLKSRSRIVQGRRRKYYEITPRGSKILEEVKPRIKELVNEVLE